MIGKILSNRYKLMDQVANGGMAWVYLAHDLVENRRVAVKVLYPQLGQDMSFVQRFTQEARLAMNLCQAAPEQHMVHVLDYGSDQEIHYLVMEYVKGRDLRQVLEEEGALPWRRALAIARQVTLALEHASQHGIVHRDIKPANVMILEDGTARVLDFGVARARTSPTLTHSGFVGSPSYVAPEQAMGRSVDIRADIYSLGIVLYEMLSGRLPFQSDTPWIVINHHIATPPPPLDQVCPDLPRAVIRLTSKAMSKRPEDRFQTPAEMGQGLEAVLAGLEPAWTEAGDPATMAPFLEGLYQQAQQAAQACEWQDAVDLFSQILKFDPRYRDVAEQLAESGRQARFWALYQAATRAMNNGRWGEALAQLDEIAHTSPAYRDVAALQVEARQKQELERLYREGVRHFEARAWRQAAECLGQVHDRDPGYSRAAELLETARAEVAKEDALLLTSPDPEARRGRRGLLWGERRSVLWGIVAVLLLALAAESYLFYRSQQAPAAAAVSNTAVPTATRIVALPPPTATGGATGRAPLSSPQAAGAGHTEAATQMMVATQATAIARPTSQATATPAPALATPSPEASPVPPAEDGQDVETATATTTATDTATATATDTATATATGTPPAPTRTPTPTGKIAFPRFDPQRGTYDVHLCDVDGSDCRLVAAEASQPDLMPDGTRLVVHSWKSDDKGLLLVGLDGGLLWRITSQIEAARPAVDFQGQVVVYHSRDELDREPRLYRTYGAQTGPLVHEAGVVRGHAPAWTPGGQILYAGCLGDACGIILADADGSRPRQFVAGGTETNPEASPDGRYVAFMSQRDGNWEVYLADLDGGEPRRLTRSPGNDGLPAWSPDGRWLAFVSDRSGRWAVWALRVDAAGRVGQPLHLFDVGGPLDGQVWEASPHELHGWVEERISWAGP
ncbi:MAG: protein kinase domain-containing protein [Anaerolineae bacterium]